MFHFIFSFAIAVGCYAHGDGRFDGLMYVDGMLYVGWYAVGLMVSCRFDGILMFGSSCLSL